MAAGMSADHEEHFEAIDRALDHGVVCDPAARVIVEVVDEAKDGSARRIEGGEGLGGIGVSARGVGWFRSLDATGAVGSAFEEARFAGAVLVGLIGGVGGLQTLRQEFLGHGDVFYAIEDGPAAGRRFLCGEIVVNAGQGFGEGVTAGPEELEELALFGRIHGFEVFPWL